MPVSRNDLCPCGSGKKYKKCCLGAPDPQAVRHSKILKIGTLALVLLTAIAFWLAGRGIGSAVGMASFALLVGYMMMAPHSTPGQQPPPGKSGPPI